MIEPTVTSMQNLNVIGLKYDCLGSEIKKKLLMITPMYKPWGGVSVRGGRFKYSQVIDEAPQSKSLYFIKQDGLLSYLLFFVEQTNPAYRVDRPPNK